MRREPDEGERELGAWLATKRAEEEAALAEAAAELTRHRLFMEAAAVETLAAVLYRHARPSYSFGWEASSTARDRASYRAEARRLINQNMETRHDG